MIDFTNKTVFITGGSRGIGRAIALKLAEKGANITIAAKSVKEDPRLGGTIFSVAQEIESAGGKALPIQCDIRFEDQINSAVEKTFKTFGGIDILINNASAISLQGTKDLTSKRFDLMHQINVRGTFLTGKACIPHLKNSEQAHILTLSPPLNPDRKWLKNHAAYTLSKYGMTMLTLSWAEEFKDINLAANTLWPRTTIDTAAVRNLLGGEELARQSRKPEIVADAALVILSKTAEDLYIGQTLIDDEVLAAEGITDLEKYAVVKGNKLYPDMFL